MEPTTIIENAYLLTMPGQLAGFPSWADHECYNIEAKADIADPAIALTQARDQNLLRLQSLLANRFQLKTHWEAARNTPTSWPPITTTKADA
jgi:uncharacterized protein (TIGR03435 family)